MSEDLTEKWNELPEYHKKTINALMVDLRAATARERPAKDDLIAAKKNYDHYANERESIEAGLIFYLQHVCVTEGLVCRDTEAFLNGEFSTERGEWDK